MATIQPSYGTRSAFPNMSNLNSLAAGAVVGLGAVDNTTTLADNYKIDTNIVLASAGVSATGTLVYYLIESGDGISYTDNLNPGGTGLVAPKNGKVVRVLNANSNSQVVIDTFDLPVITCPKKFGIIVANSSGAALPVSGNAVSFTPITYTST
jgi:hypothetical protein